VADALAVQYTRTATHLHQPTHTHTRTSPSIYTHVHALTPHGPHGPVPSMSSSSMADRSGADASLSIEPRLSCGASATCGWDPVNECVRRWTVPGCVSADAAAIAMAATDACSMLV
jgi:hypothetical protein